MFRQHVEKDLGNLGDTKGQATSTNRTHDNG
jgi:hypothetical protein